jgi:hypothetical protein
MLVCCLVPPLLGAAAWSQSPLSLYANGRYRSSVVEVPDGNGVGGTLETPTIVAAGDGSASYESFVGWDLNTLRYRVSIVGAYQQVPYGDRASHGTLHASEALLDLDFGKPVYFELGKKKEKIGSGYFRHPTDILVPNPEQVRIQTGDDADRTREGLVGAGVQHVNPTFSIGAFASPRLAWSDSGLLGKYVSSPQRRHQGFLKGSTRIGQADLEMLYRLSVDSAGTLASAMGANAVTSLGDHLEFHFDGLVSQDQACPLPPPDGAEVRDFVLQSVLGFVYTLDANWGVIGEYYHNGAGLSGTEYDAALRYMSLLTARGRSRESERFRNAYGPLSLGRNYAMSRLSYTAQDKFLAEALVMLNLQDAGAYASSRLTYAPSTWMKVRSELGGFAGDDSTEAGSIGGLWHVEFGLELFY